MKYLVTWNSAREMWAVRRKGSQKVYKHFKLRKQAVVRACELGDQVYIFTKKGAVQRKLEFEVSAKYRRMFKVWRKAYAEGYMRSSDGIPLKQP